MQPVTSAIPMSLVDFSSIASSVGFNMPSDPREAVFELVVSEMEAVGGVGFLEVEEEGMFCVWDPPPLGPDVDSRRLAYLSHMLQAGLVILPKMLIANTAYNGMGIPLARAIVAFSTLNPYVAERDSGLLANAMPFSPHAWLAHGLVLMDNMKFRLAVNALYRSVVLDISNSLSLKCLAVCLTATSPKQAVNVAEDMMVAIAKDGKVPDSHARAVYGFALLAARMKKDSGVQFEVAFGKRVPLMTVRQWREWGHKLPVETLIKALWNPKAFVPKNG